MSDITTGWYDASAPTPEQTEQENYAARAREAATLRFEIDPELAGKPAFFLQLDGEDVGGVWEPDGNETTEAFFSILNDVLFAARLTYAYMLGKQGLSQEDFDSTLIGMTPVETPQGGIPFGEMFNPDSTAFAGSNAGVATWFIPNAPASPDDPEYDDSADSHPIFPDPEYNEATDADTDLAGDETTGG